MDQLLSRFARDEDGLGAVDFCLAASAIALATFGVLNFLSDRRPNDPKQWRARANEARALARQIDDHDTVEVMTRVAEDYDFLAEHAEELRQRSQRPDVASRSKDESARFSTTMQQREDDARQAVHGEQCSEFSMGLKAIRRG